MDTRSLIDEVIFKTIEGHLTHVCLLKFVLTKFTDCE